MAGLDAMRHRAERCVTHHHACDCREFERALLRERQREGIALARQRGAYRGRKKALSTAQLDALHQRLETGGSKAQIARDFGISRETLYQYLRAKECP